MKLFAPHGAGTAVVIAHQNASLYGIRERNLKHTLRYFAQADVAVYLAYMAPPGLDHAFRDPAYGEHVVQVDQHDNLWNREALINLAVTKLVIPRGYDRVLWCDADIEMFRLGDRQPTSAFRQPFAHVYRQDRLGNTTVQQTLGGALQTETLHAGFPLMSKDCGTAWEAPIEFWHHGGLYPTCFSGQFEILLAAMLGQVMTEKLATTLLGPDWMESWYQYENAMQRSFATLKEPRIAPAPAGTWALKGYVFRSVESRAPQQALVQHIKPSDIRRDEHTGLSRWSAAVRPTTKEASRRVFAIRREDG